MTTTIDEQKALAREPKAMSEITISLVERDAFIDEQIHRATVKPDEFNMPGKCKACDCSLGDDRKDWVWGAGRFGFILEIHCESCKAAKLAEMALEEKLARDAALSGIIPSEFITWDAAQGNERLAAAVRSKFSYTDRRGFVIHGTSGKCKTRIIWQIVRGIIEQPESFTWLVIDSYEAATKGIPAEAEKVSFLFIDDLGNEPTTTKYETSLLNLIRRRCDWHKPIFITTQLNGAQFKQRFFQGPAASAILRRLTDRSTMINADGPGAL